MRKKITWHVMVLAVWLVAANVAQGAKPDEFAGTWVMRLGDRNLFVLTLTPEGEGVRGSFERPGKFSSTGSIFTGLSASTRQDKVVRSHFADGVLHLTIQNPSDAKDEDSYRMVVNGNQAALTPDDLPAAMVLEPYLFDRAAAGAKVATDWELNRAYTTGDSDIPSAEMKKIFDEDQRVREAEHINWDVVNRTDAERREQTRKLLAAGALHTGKDYEEAAFIFQHGDSAQDYLLGHTLAMVAVSKGDSTAIWIAAATLDRYLQRAGQKQIFGTQYLTDPKGGSTQDPYDRELVSDALRHQLGVPAQATQAQQLKVYQTQK
ncbi:MAG: hypothetical protein ABSF68_00830 [Candidatus Acidiferrales bacterium]|jgi:hypothetical protein